MDPVHDILIVGAGIFGMAAALELDARRYDVAILDPGPLPQPLAASTDISKVIRMEYGADEQYMAMVEAAIPGWERWNQELGDRLYHKVGVLMLTRAPMAPGGYEYESYQMLLKRGHDPVRLDAQEITRRFPAWKPGVYVDGFFHAEGGYAESGRVVDALVNRARRQAIPFHLGQSAAEVVEQDGRVTGVRTRAGDTFRADHVVIATGSWTPLLIPELERVMRPVGQPVFHVEPARPDLFSPPDFSVFTADVSHTGWYGFPLHPHQRVVKIANHGAGQLLDPEKDTRLVTETDEQKLHAFLAETFPDLLAAPIVYTRQCLYCDTPDEHLWIDQDPSRSGLTVAAGGSGHGFKFGPILGALIADAVEGKPNPWLSKFRWRELPPTVAGEEAARYHGRL